MDGNAPPPRADTGVPAIDQRPDQVETLRLGRFDSHGTTRARHGNRWIEVEHGIPGEVVRAQVVGTKRLAGRIVEVLEPNEDRVEAPCGYFRDWACGGCQWQMIAYAGQVRRKQEQVDAAMAAAGLDLRIGAVHTLDEPWRYRSTAGISLGRHAGFRRHASLAIVPIRDCPISASLVGRLMAQLNDQLESGNLPDFRGRIRLDVRIVSAESGDGLQILIRQTDPRKPIDAREVQALAQTVSVFQDVTGVSVLEEDGTVTAVSGELFAPTLVAGKQVWLTAGSFFQTNLRLLPVLVDRLRVACGSLVGKRVADVYAGVGLFGLYIAGDAARVDVIETDALALEACRRTARAWRIANVETIALPAESALAAGTPYDIVIVDPPRTGLDEQVLAALAARPPGIVLYVSCLAESLARDLAVLAPAGYRLESLELFDFYPQTYHVELLAVLRQE